MGVFELIRRLNGGPLETVDTMEIPDLFRYLNYGVRIDTFEVGSVKIEPTTWPTKKKDDQDHVVIENKVDQELAIVTAEPMKKKEVKKDICSQLDEFSSFVQQEILGLDHNSSTKKLQEDDLKCQHKKKKTTTNRVKDRVLQEEIKICSTLKEENQVQEKRLIVNNIGKKELGDQDHGKRSQITLKKEEDSLIVMEVELDGSRKKLREEKIENTRKKRCIDDQVIETEKKPCKQAKKQPVVKKKHQHPLFKQRRNLLLPAQKSSVL